jgi:hypothetical protein
MGELNWPALLVIVPAILYCAFLRSCYLNLKEKAEND